MNRPAPYTTVGGCGLPGHDTAYVLAVLKPHMRQGWRWEHRCLECEREKNRERSRRQQERFLQTLHEACVCCDESTVIFLSLDHVNGQGNEHRRQVPHRRVKCELIRTQNGRVLCRNCNRTVYHNGKCTIPSHNGVTAPVRPLSQTGSAVRCRRYRAKLKALCLVQYSTAGEFPECVCCGLTELAALGLDHVYANREEWLRERGIKGLGGTEMYAWLRDRNWPEKDALRTLCDSCNFAVYHLGQCPGKDHKQVVRPKELV